MRKIAHIVNPVAIGEKSDLSKAQPITFATMRTSKEFANKEVEVELYTAQFPEDRSMVPEGFTATPDLERSVLDFGSFRGNRKLPLIADILDRLYEATSAEFLIYTNVDIALMPSFYTTVNRLIDAGFDAFAINRRGISSHYQSVNEIPLMVSEIGKRHDGHDCFVFRRDRYPDFVLGKTAIGIVWIGRILICNLAIHSTKFREFKRRHLTFHIGDDDWKGAPIHQEYVRFNEAQVLSSLRVLEKSYGPFSGQDAVYPYFSTFMDQNTRAAVVRGSRRRTYWLGRLQKLLRLTKS